jgi:hypothetical protein
VEVSAPARGSSPGAIDGEYNGFDRARRFDGRRNGGVFAGESIECVTRWASKS